MKERGEKHAPLLPLLFILMTDMALLPACFLQGRKGGGGGGGGGGKGGPFPLPPYFLPTPYLPYFFVIRKKIAKAKTFFYLNVHFLKQSVNLKTLLFFWEFVELRTFSTSVSSPSPSPFSPFIVSHFLFFPSSSFRLSKCWERMAFTFLFLFLGTRVSRFFPKIWKLAWYHKKARTKLKKYFCNAIMLI